MNHFSPPPRQHLTNFNLGSYTVFVIIITLAFDFNKSIEISNKYVLGGDWVGLLSFTYYHYLFTKQKHIYIYVSRNILCNIVYIGVGIYDVDYASGFVTLLDIFHEMYRWTFCLTLCLIVHSFLFL